MEIKNTFILSVLLLLCTIMQIPVMAHQDGDCSVSLMEKVYVIPAQLHIVENGIFFLNDLGSLEAAVGVFHDNQGLYIMTRTYQCPSCKMRNRTGKCINSACSLYGK